jgi:predicted regulator of Ras-like GTPase activity (Roadblock/LC7/MglB family)
MMRVLEPLARIAGVRMALLVAPDGVPVIVRGTSTEALEPPEAADEDGVTLGTADTAESLSALATGWLGELSRAIAPLTWNAPERVVMTAARGTIVMVPAPGAVLLVILDRGASPEELRLPMEATVARMHRVLRSLHGDTPTLAHTTVDSATQPTPSDSAGPGSALPTRPEDKSSALVSADSPPRHSPREFPV